MKKCEPNHEVAGKELRHKAELELTQLNWCTRRIPNALRCGPSSSQRIPSLLIAPSLLYCLIAIAEAAFVLPLIRSDGKKPLNAQ